MPQKDPPKTSKEDPIKEVPIGGDGQQFTAPSGMVYRIRPMKVKEQNALADRAKMRSGVALSQILDACLLGVDDPGVYAGWGIEDGARLNPLKLLQGDRFHMLVNLRKISVKDGKNYEIPATCTECGEKDQSNAVDLDALTVQELPKASRAILESGDNKFAFGLEVAKRTCWFKLATGEDELKFAKIQHQQRQKLSSAALRMRVLEVEGVKGVDLPKWIESEMYTQDAEALRDYMDQVDCGVDTTIDVACPSCGETYDFDIPFGDSRFLIPAVGISKRARMRRQRN